MMSQNNGERAPSEERVREIYCRHPYPPPVEGLEGYGKQWEDERLHRADYHIFWPPQPYREELDILIAGAA